jgi:MarR family transcriptional regulator, 2-MHQ and catechol-resistance regulon repressor
MNAADPNSEPRALRVSEEQAQCLKLWVVLARAYAAVGAHSEGDIERHGLTPGEFGILDVLFHKGPMLLGEVQRKVLVSSGGITYLIDRLTEKGLVERRACPHDRRARYAALTHRGESLFAEIFPEHARCIEVAVSGLDAEEREQAIALIRRLGRAAAGVPSGSCRSG